MTSTVPVFVVDRASCLTRPILVETIARYLEKGAVVQIEDSSEPVGERLRYTIQMVDGVGHVFDANDRRLGVFADVQALVKHAESVTT